MCCWRTLYFTMMALMVLLPLGGCTGDDDNPGDDDSSVDVSPSPEGDDDTTTGDDDSPIGDDDSPVGDDDTAGDDDTTSGDDDTVLGDDDTGLGDDDTQAGDDDTVGGDDDTNPGDDDSLEPTPECTPAPDADGDGFGVANDCNNPDGAIDCDDANGTVYPGAEEVCEEAGQDAIDNNCDGQADEGLTLPWYRDEDGDGYGLTEETVLSCNQPDGYVSSDGDCDDANPNSYPDAPETCDQQDNNCDGTVDEGVVPTWYPDADTDSFGDADSQGLSACEAPEGYVLNAEDCDDTDAAVHPEAEEICNTVDDNCDGQVDEGVTLSWYLDLDGDGYGDDGGLLEACEQPAGYVAAGGDCHDGSSSIYPGATEVCDGLDNNCVDGVDEGLLEPFYPDLDGDGYGNPEGLLEACSAPEAYVAIPGDCDDTDASIHPEVFDLCDGLDNNCDGTIDEGEIFYPDLDADSYGDETGAAATCDPPDYYTQQGGDCDDTNPAINPEAWEECDGIDNDCSGVADDGPEQVVAYLDEDGDGYGQEEVATNSCGEIPDGYAWEAGDCDDTRLEVYPDAEELCDGLDNNCDGQVDEEDTFYPDDDGDGYGVSDQSTVACEGMPAGHTPAGGDCDDARADVYPGALEVCDGVDNNCDGLGDEEGTYYLDQDQDGYGISGITVNACGPSAGYAEVAGDCNDSDAETYPGAEDYCDGRDNNCDGVVDEEGVLTFYPDNDADGYGMDEGAVSSCEWLEGYSTEPGDCDDTNPDVNPAMWDGCDGVDSNCNGLIDEEDSGETLYRDGDSDGYGDDTNALLVCEGEVPDGYAWEGGDCDDTNPDVYPSAEDICDGLDNNCDGQVDEEDTYFLDQDQDGYGISEAAITSCDGPLGNEYASLDGDCDDGDSSINPGAQEQCDGLDNDCDGQADEPTHYYLDADHDGFGAEEEPIVSCDVPGKGYAERSGDCDDTDEFIFPGAEEVCDGLDNDCDALVDEAIGDTYYLDGDGDGYGNDAAIAYYVCFPSGDQTGIGGDCNDEDPDIYPGAPEQCDGYDYNCNGEVDDVRTYYPDVDGDGFGWTDDGVTQCGDPGGTSLARGDCNDKDPAIHPGAEDGTGDGLDQDCGGTDDADPHVGLSLDSLETMSEALDAADNGNIIWVGPGAYSDFGLDFAGLEVTLISTLGPDETTVTTEGQPLRFVTDEGAATLLDGFSFYGSPLVIENASPTIARCRFSESWTGESLAVISGSASSFEQCAFDGGLASEGGAMHILDATLSFTECSFTNNLADSRGGAVYLDGSTAFFENSTFEDNQAGSDGGAIFATNGTLRVNGGILSRNAAGATGGAISGEGSDVEVATAELSGNGSSEAGGAIYLTGSLGFLDGATLIGNESGQGGAYYEIDTSSGIERSTFLSNYAWNGGGALYFQDTSPVILEGTFEDNQSGGDGGALVSTYGTAIIEDGVFQGNWAMGNGGVIASYGGTINLTRAQVSDSVAGVYGGALFLEDADAVLSGCDLTFQEAYGGGGVYQTSGNLAVEDSTFHDNQVSSEGGVFLVNDSAVVVSNSWFARNQAEYQGGTIWAYNSSLAVNTSRLQGNDAPFGGGAIYVTDGTFAGTNVVIAHNTSLEAVGAGIMAFNTDTVMAASAITGNLSGGEGAGLYIDGDVGVPSTALDSCVLAYNTPYNIYALIQDGFSTTVRNNDLYSPNGEPNHNIASLHSTNLTVEPGFMAYDGEGLPEDFHLQRDSLLVDAGSAVQFDPDGSPSDIGAYSGVGAGSYNLDHDSVPDYYWPGRWLEAPVGVDRDAYDCDDLDPDVQGCF